MATQFAEVISRYAMPIIDDVRLTEEMETSSALFLRRMSVMLTAAIPYMNNPPTLQQYLQDGLTDAEYDDYYAEAISNTIETGKTGYEIVTCQTVEPMQDGTVYNHPIEGAEYDPETGIVTIPAIDLTAGTIQIDFYKDGTFGNDLSPNIKHLLGLAIAIIWDERFTRNWLNIQMKNHDKSFDVVNEGTYMRESQARLEKNRAEFYAQMRKYEQDCAYAKSVGLYGKKTVFI